MKNRKCQPMLTTRSVFARDIEVRQEIEAYVAALKSYPDRFADNPSISFQQHLSSVVASQLCAERRNPISPGRSTSAA